jgi:hypothetical protein
MTLPFSVVSSTTRGGCSIIAGAGAAAFATVFAGAGIAAGFTGARAAAGMGSSTSALGAAFEFVEVVVLFLVGALAVVDIFRFL